MSPLTNLQAVVLGAVQGASEFLPISSSAHLVLAPWLFGWDDPGLSYDVALHVGTLLAILIYFAKDWLTLAKDGLSAPQSPEGRKLWLLAAATIPGAVIGKLFEHAAEHAFRSPLAVAANLAIFGLLLGWAENRGSKRLGEDAIDLRMALLIGLAQALAVAPGVSRSGSTITAGLLLGLTPQAAVRFSFLMSGPILAGAAILKLRHLGGIDAPLALGIAASAITGMAAIGGLMRLVRARSLKPFVVYRVAVAAAIVALYFTRG